MRVRDRARIVTLQTRTVVIGLLIGVLVVSAGFSGLLGDGETANELLVVNQDGTDHTVVVEILEEGSLVYSDGRTLEAESQLELARFNRTGEFEMRITVDGESTTRSHTFSEDAEPPAVTNIGIDNEGQITVA